LLRALHGTSGPGGPSTPESIDGALSWAATAVTISVARALAAYVHGLLAARLGHDVVRQLRAKLYAHLLRVPMTALQSLRRGGIAARLGHDVMRVEGLITHDVGAIVSASLTLLGLTLFVASLDAQLALVGLSAFPVLAWVTWRLALRARRAHREVWAQHAELASRASEVADAALTLRAYGATAQAEAAFDLDARELERRSLAARAWATVAGPAVQALGACALFGALALGAHRVAAGTLHTETFVSFAAAVVLLYRPVQGLAQGAQQWVASLAALDRVGELLDMPLEADASVRPVALPPFARELRLDGVRFSYDPARPVLGPLDLTIRPGERVALSGPSGTGKTTLVHILVGLLPAQGRISIDGVGIDDATRETWRAQFAWVPQDPPLFAGSVLFNVTLGEPDATPKRAREALELAGAWPLVERLGGLEARLLEAGRALSAGERQRIALARGLCRNSPILVLDEATSSLDAEAEERVLAAIHSRMPGRTLIHVSHREANLRRAHRVLELRDGTLVERRDEVARPRA
jgi:subfamily B ATP-binding cassette protein MsbA